MGDLLRHRGRGRSRSRAGHGGAGRGRRGDPAEIEERLAIEARRQDGLHRGIAVLPDRTGAGAGGLQPGRAVPLGEAEDALRAAQAIEGPIAEERGDELGAGRADLGRLLLAPAGRLQQEVDLVRGQVIVQGASLAGARRAVARDQRVGVEELDLRAGGPDPEPLPDQAVRRRVVGPVEDDMAVRMELGLLPGHRGPGRGRQREKRRALDGLEENDGLLLGGAVAPAPGRLHTPAERVRVGVMDVAERPARQAVALHVVDAPLFDLPLVLGRAGATGGDEEAVVLGQLPVDALHLGIVERGLDDGGLEVVEHHPARHAREPLEGRAVAAAPGGDGLVEDELDVLVAAVRQGHHERPGAAQAAVVGIEQQPRRAEVDLGLLAGRGLDPERRARGRRLHPPEEPLHRRVAPGEAVLFDEELEDGLALHALLAPAHHLVPERGHAGLFLRRALALGRAEQRGQRRRVRQVARQQPVTFGPAPVAGHGVPAQSQLPGDPALRLACAESAEHFAYIGHLTPPSSHRRHLRVGSSRRQIADPAGKRKGSGRRVRVAQLG